MIYHEVTVSLPEAQPYIDERLALVAQFVGRIAHGFNDVASSALDYAMNHATNFVERHKRGLRAAIAGVAIVGGFGIVTEVAHASATGTFPATAVESTDSELICKYKKTFGVYVPSLFKNEGEFGESLLVDQSVVKELNNADKAVYETWGVTLNKGKKVVSVKMPVGYVSGIMCDDERSNSDWLKKVKLRGQAVDPVTTIAAQPAATAAPTPEVAAPPAEAVFDPNTCIATGRGTVSRPLEIQCNLGRVDVVSLQEQVNVKAGTKILKVDGQWGDKTNIAIKQILGIFSIPINTDTSLNGIELVSRLKDAGFELKFVDTPQEGSADPSNETSGKSPAGNAANSTTQQASSSNLLIKSDSGKEDPVAIGICDLPDGQTMWVTSGSRTKPARQEVESACPNGEITVGTDKGWRIRAKSGGGEVNTGGKVGTILEQIRQAEAGPAGYNSFNSGSSGDSLGGNKNFANLTIQQVLDMQSNGEIFAAGAYQYIRGTLLSTANAAGVPLTRKYNKQTQDELAGWQVQGILNAGGGLKAVQDGVCKVWAGIKCSNGKGKYDRVGNNTANFTLHL